MAYKWQQNRQDVKFINPYNFVPLGDVCAKKEKVVSVDEKLLTGRIECEIIPKTDLFVPNTSSDVAFDTHAEDEDENNYHKSYDFFSYTDLKGGKSGNEPQEPVIPGSEIRGVMRNCFETLTDSCLKMDYDRPIFTRTPDIKNPGVLFFNHSSNRWELYKAENIRFWSTTPLKMGNTVKFKAIQGNRPYIYSIYGTATQGKYDPINNATNILRELEHEIKTNRNNVEQKITKDDIYGIVLRGESPSISRKKYEHIFKFSELNNGNPINISEETLKSGIEKLEAALKLYADENINQLLKKDKPTGGKEHSGYKEYAAGLERCLKNKTIYPVYYEEHNGKYYFSPACISKNVYYNTLKNIVKNSTKNAEDYIPCDDKNKLCPACGLFGTVTENKNNFALVSRLRFSDAVYCGDTPPQYQSPLAIGELANPKFRCFEFYMTNAQNNLKSAFDLEESDVMIRGRKFYLHHKPSYEKVDPSKLNCSIRPLKTNGAKFKFDVFFDKISEKELQQILTVLSNGNNNDENLCHKIGKAKPLGYGSIKIKVTGVCVRNIKSKDFVEDKTDDYRNYFEGGSDWIKTFPTNQTVIASYKRIIDFATANGKTVSYPVAINYEFEKETDPQKKKEKQETSEASYQWFIGNRRLGNRQNNGRTEYASEMKWIVQKSLPRILDGNLQLPKLEKIEETNDSPPNSYNNKDKNFSNNSPNYGNRKG